MQIVDFTTAHIEQAAQIALQNYFKECARVPVLPPVGSVPDLSQFIENNLGVTALEGDAIIGFLCAVGPHPNAFGSTDAVMVFSPMGANGATGKNRAQIYARMYQAAGLKWVRAGASSHGICLYAHDEEAQRQFYRYGFGLRRVDAIRELDGIAAPPCAGYDFFEPAPEDALQILPLENMLDKGYIESPFFMYRKINDEAAFLENNKRYKSIYIAAKYKGRIVAFIRAELDGETFIQNTPGYLHCKGLYCLPEHRGKGVSQQLLNILIQKLSVQGYTRLGVDFESLNPSGSGFWQKYFNPYTHSVVRRIDEYAISKRS
jgi:GNAT superfamily N-acetyltransferase